MMRDKETKQETEISIYDYFLRKYNIALQRSNFPLVKTTKKGMWLMLSAVSGGTGGTANPLCLLQGCTFQQSYATSSRTSAIHTS